MIAKTQKISSPLKGREIYSENGETVFVTSVSKVLICYGKRGYFPCKPIDVEFMPITPASLVKTIQEVSEKDIISFPYPFVMGIIETKDKQFATEFLDKLKKSQIKPEIKKEIIGRYETNEF